MKTIGKGEMIFWLCLAIAILIGFGYLTGRTNKQLQAQVRDLQVQLAKANVPMKRDTVVILDKDTVEVVTQRVVEIDKTDYKKQVADRELIKDLGMKVSQIEAENHMLRETLGSVILQPVKSDSDTIFAYHDHWTDFTVNTRQRQLAYAVRDSLATYIERIPRHRFLWLRWGVKGYYLKHVNFNKNSTILYNSYIKVKE
jgi:hypothetical protein